MARLRFGRPISLRWNGLLLEGPALTVFEIPDEYYEEFNQDIGPVEPTLVWLDSDEGSTLRARVTALEVSGSATLSNDAAVALGTASAGVGTEASRDDHVHPTTGLSLSGHNHDGSYATTGHNHSGVYELSGAVSTHVGESDPHTQYLTETAASSTYSTTSHNHSGVYEASGSVSAHAGESDPHTQYLTETAASSTYSTTSHNHSGVYEASGAVSSHVGESDPHTQYLTETSASSTYATTGHNHSGTYEPVNTAILKSVVDAKGDLIVGTAADTVDRLPGSGTNGYVLTYDSAESTGLKWAAAPGSGGGASVGNATPLALGTASAGDDATASREDHVHPTTGLALSGHNHDASYTAIGDTNRADIVFETCKNSSGSAIAKGKVVYINGSDGTNPTIALSDADTEATSSKTLGFTETSSNNGDQVNVITHGRLTNVDTSAASTEGVSVWLSGTAGDFVFGAPPSEPAHAVYLGVVTKKNASTGEIFVKIQNGYEIDELHDVSAASPDNNDVLQFVSSTGLWTKKSLSAAGIAPTASPTFTGTVTTPLTTAGYVKTNSSGVLSSSSQIAQGDVTNLTTDLAAKAPLASPTFTGTVILPSDTSIGNVSSTEIGYVDGVTSAIQTQINAKAPTANPTFTGTVTTPLTTAGYVKTSAGGVLSSSAAIAQADVTNLTTDLAAKAPTSSPTFTGDVTLNAQGDIRFADSDSSNWVGLQAPATISSNVMWTLPSSDGSSGQVLSTNGTGTLSWATASGTISFNQQTGTSYTLAASDANKIVELSNTGAITLTIPTNTAVPISVGTQIDIVQTNTGQVTVGGSGVTIQSNGSRLKLNGQWAAATLVKRATDTWVLIGNTVS